MVNQATLVHWPDQKGQVQDDLLTGLRAGSFPEREQYRAAGRTA